jgi:hypothetical protein
VFKEASGAREKIHGLEAEIDRLNDILEKIYRSKTWKLHELIERFRTSLRAR